MASKKIMAPTFSEIIKVFVILGFVEKWATAKSWVSVRGGRE
jgi:hypothetical protein